MSPSQPGVTAAAEQGDAIEIGVLGLGHVGLVTALGLAELGWRVVGADDDREKAQRIAGGEAPFYEPGIEDALRRHLSLGQFRVAPDGPSAIRAAQILFVCVGTPLDRSGQVDLSQVEAVARTVARNLNGYKLVVEKSTTPARTAEQIERVIRRDSGLANSSFDVAVNPEFLREGTALKDFLNPDRIVLGVESERAAGLLVRLYRPLLERLPEGASRLLVVDRTTAELVKHAANAFLAVKVSFINMVADICEAVGADVEMVAQGLGLDPRIGPEFLRAGVGYGGYCLPKDLRSFTRIGEALGVDAGLLEAADRVNEARVERFVEKVRRALWVLRGKTVAVWGLAFKPGTDDVREAPSLKIVARLLDEGVALRLYDPRAMGEFRRHFAQAPGQLVYCSSAVEAVRGSEALLILTEWPEFREQDFSRVRELMALPVVVDGRNCLDREALQNLGFEYHGMGRG